MITFVQAGLLLVLALLGRFFVLLYKRRTSLNGYPMPPHSFWLGHIPVIAKLVAELPPNIHPHTFSHYLRKKYDLPDVFYIDTWPIGFQICAVVDPDAAQQVAVKQCLPKHESIDTTIWPLAGYKSLVSLEGQEHRQWRSAFNPGFNTSHLMSLVPNIVDDCQVFAEILEQHVEQQDIFQLEEAATKVTIDVIGKVVLDVSLNAQKGENEFVTAFRSSLSWVDLQSVNPFVVFNPIRAIIFRRNARIMKRYLVKLMNERFAQRSKAVDKDTKKRSKPIIDLALDTYTSETGAVASETLDQAFITQALSHIRVFMFGGHDTTSSTICWIGYALLKNPSCLLQFREECDSVFGPDPALTAERIRTNPQLLNKLPYTLAIIKEVLRIWPAASSVRQGQPDFFVHYDDRDYPTDGMLTWPVVHALHRNPKFWPRPEEFLPERWTAKEGDELYPVKGAWRAFEHGPRNCIGQELAIIETKIIMCLVFRTMTIEPAYDEWDRMHGLSGKQMLTPEGERAYQVLVATAKPCEGLPTRMKKA